MRAINKLALKDLYRYAMANSRDKRQANVLSFALRFTLKTASLKSSVLSNALTIIKILFGETGE